MLALYPSDVRLLSDNDIARLIKEIEESGVLESDEFDYEQDSWEFQASQRWSELLMEQRRRNPLTAREPLSLGIISDITLRMVRAETTLNSFVSDELFKLKSGGH